MACQQTVPLVSASLLWKLINNKPDNPTPPPRSKREGQRSGGTSMVLEGNEDEDSDSVNGDGTTRKGEGDSVADSAYQMSALVETPMDDVEIIGTLGYGRNGVVFLANWHGQKVALKLFDVGKDGYEFFDREVEAYLALQAVWGSLVPTPLFVYESWSGWITFIGLQLGREPVPGDNLSDWSNVLSTLENEYGFRHEDAEAGNMVFVFDEKTGSERLVAIDLESHTMIK
jgi:hypothetical protein